MYMCVLPLIETRYIPTFLCKKHIEVSKFISYFNFMMECVLSEETIWKP
jgi:hypothetical protein